MKLLYNGERDIKMASPRASFLFEMVKNGAFRRSPKKFFHYLNKGLIHIVGGSEAMLLPENQEYLRLIVKTFNSFRDFEWDFEFSSDKIHTKLILKGLVLRFKDVTITKVGAHNTFPQRELFLRVPFSFFGDKLVLGRISVFTTKLAWNYLIAGSRDEYMVHPHVHSISSSTFFNLRIEDKTCYGSGDFSATLEYTQIERLSEDDLIFYILNLKTFISSQSSGQPYVNIQNLVKRKHPSIETTDVKRDFTIVYKSLAETLYNRYFYEDVRSHLFVNNLNFNMTFSGAIEFMVDDNFYIFTLALLEYEHYNNKTKVFIINRNETKYSLHYYNIKKNALVDASFTKQDLPRASRPPSYLFLGEEHVPTFYYRDFETKTNTVTEAETEFIDVHEDDFKIDPDFVEVFADYFSRQTSEQVFTYAPYEPEKRALMAEFLTS